MSLPTLLVMAREREFSGKLSASRALNGLRLEYLKFKEDYAVNPREGAFMLLGVLAHRKLEGAAHAAGLSEHAEQLVEDETGRGIFDFYDLSEKTVWDYKTMGSWKAARAIGVSYRWAKTGQYYVKGPKKGTPKFQKEFFIDPNNRDLYDLAIQVNRYRMLAESIGLPVEKMKAQIIVRDGGLKIAEERGVTEKLYVLDVPYISDHHLKRFFETKSKALNYHIQNNILPPPCKPRERWNDRRCKGYCPVSEFCDYARD